jgi:hypothetical protein
MAVESLNPSKQLPVVTTRYEHLSMRAGCCLKEGEGASGKFMLFYEANLVFRKLTARLVEQVSRGGGSNG